MHRGLLAAGPQLQSTSEGRGRSLSRAFFVAHWGRGDTLPGHVGRYGRVSRWRVYDASSAKVERLGGHPGRHGSRQWDRLSRRNDHGALEPARVGEDIRSGRVEPQATDRATCATVGQSSHQPPELLHSCLRPLEPHQTREVALGSSVRQGAAPTVGMGGPSAPRSPAGWPRPPCRSRRGYGSGSPEGAGRRAAGVACSRPRCGRRGASLAVSRRRRAFGGRPAAQVVSLPWSPPARGREGTGVALVALQRDVAAGDYELGPRLGRDPAPLLRGAGDDVRSPRAG